MKTVAAFIVFLSLHIVAVYCDDEKPMPVFVSPYYAKGHLELPFADLVEQFQEWHDEENELSRRDYYNGLVQYVCKGEQKSQLVWADKEGEDIDQRTCFLVAEDEMANCDSILPDLDGYEYKGEEECPIPSIAKNNICDKWEKVISGADGERSEHYTFYVTRDEDGNDIPVYYKMLGVNPVLGSSYDRSEMAFTEFSSEPFNNTVYDIADNFTCEPYAVESDGHDYVNDIIRYNYHHIHPHFEEFKMRHGKEYPDRYEHEMRMNIFRQNHRFVQATNRKGLSYRVELNHFADWTSAEYKRLSGAGAARHSPRRGTIPFHLSEKEIPENLDWRLYGAVTAVKNQATCGSCWSFGTTGSTEGAYFLKHKVLPSLSEQQLIDCAWFADANGCQGGLADWAWTYAMQTGGMSTEAEYGDYLMVDGKCHDNQTKRLVTIKGYTDLPAGNDTAMTDALANTGPVAIAINANPRSLMLYANGVYDDPACNPEDVDHQVLAIGYGTMEGKKYWLVKNSWGIFWGNQGYILIAQANDTCGVTQRAAYPTVL